MCSFLVMQKKLKKINRRNIGIWKKKLYSSNYMLNWETSGQILPTDFQEGTNGLKLEIITQ